MADDVKTTYGISETLEALDFVDSLLGGFANVFADGKVGLLDIKHVPPLIKNANTGLRGMNLIPKEVMDLDPNEMDRILAKVVGLAARADELKAAISALRAKAQAK